MSKEEEQKKDIVIKIDTDSIVEKWFNTEIRGNVNTEAYNLLIVQKENLKQKLKGGK